MGIALRDVQTVCTAMIVASPDSDFRGRVARSLAPSGRALHEVRGGAEALKLLEAMTCETLLVDRWLPDLDVNEVVEIVRTRHPHVRVMVVDSKARIHGEISAEPTADLVMPDESLALAEPGAPWPSENPNVTPLPGMVGASKAMQTIYRLASLVAPRTTPVMIAGETGTGKELVARGIHARSLRSKHRFVVVNCAANPDTLLEAELFGFTRGAFTGAFQSRVGRIQAAQGGTLLLDEIGEMPMSMQAKLLRFLQEGEIQPLGSPEVFRVDVRVVASTNAKLTARIREGRFREDLYYRLMVFPIELSPLRERRDDICPLAEHFLEALSRDDGVVHKHFTRHARSFLAQQDWPGNVRQLRHAIERAFILSDASSEVHPGYLQFL